MFSLPPPLLSSHVATSKLAGCTLFITGASRGIGKAIALRAAQDGANIVIAAKTAVPHPKLPGTIYTAAEEGVFMCADIRTLQLTRQIPRTLTVFLCLGIWLKNHRRVGHPPFFAKFSLILWSKECPLMWTDFEIELLHL